MHQYLISYLITCYRITFLRLQNLLIEFLSNGTAKVKLAILTFFYCREFVKNLIGKVSFSSHLHWRKCFILVERMNDINTLVLCLLRRRFIHRLTFRSHFEQSNYCGTAASALRQCHGLRSLWSAAAHRGFPCSPSTDHRARSSRGNQNQSGLKPLVVHSNDLMNQKIIPRRWWVRYFIVSFHNHDHWIGHFRTLIWTILKQKVIGKENCKKFRM